jgi:type IV pilus assembly protein PilA
MRRPVRSSAGFTLVELLIAVAIIGLLAAIAAERYDEQRFRARQSEAQVNLQALFAAEQSYYAASNTYTNNLGSAGFAPERGNRYAYYIDSPATAMQTRTAAKTTAVAGMDAVGVDTFAHPQLSTTPAEFGTDGSITFVANPGGTAIPAGSVTYVSTGPSGAFLARAFGWISSSATTSFDAWFISSQGATVTSPCLASNAGRVSAGAPGSTYDQSSCF